MHRNIKMEKNVEAKKHSASELHAWCTIEQVNEGTRTLSVLLQSEKLNQSANASKHRILRKTEWKLYINCLLFNNTG